MSSSQQSLHLGFDVGGTKCAVVIGTSDGQIIDRKEWPSHAARGPQAMLDDLFRHAAIATTMYPEIASVGVSIGGPLDADAGIILGPPNLPGWDHVPLRDLLQERLNRPTANALDAAACCLAEATWGAGVQQSRVAYLTCGTGFGAGLVIDGRIYTGARGRSIEIGHVRYRDDGPTAFGKIGCFEAFCAGSSLPRLAAWKFPQRWSASPPDSRALFELTKQGDADAQAILNLNATATGYACALLGDLFVPDLIVLGSLARYFGEPWVAAVRERFAAQVLGSVAEHTRIVPSQLADRLQDLSALVVATTLADK